MAFLCPARMRRDKKKATNANIEHDLAIPVGVGLGLNHGMGRITGSSSIETLVRVGIEKEHGLSPDSKMVVLHDFTPCVDDELEVKRGHIVNILYRENDWVYVIGQDTRQEGFIPYSYCAPYNTQLADLAIKKKLPREQKHLKMSAELGENIPLLSSGEEDLIISNNASGGGAGVAGGCASLKNSEMNLLLMSEPECVAFHKEPSGRFIVLYTFVARDENDLSVERGEFVTVLNRDDPDWYWIVRSDGQEGFIPSGFVYPAESVLQVQVQQAKMLNMCGNGENNTASGGGGVVAPLPKTTEISTLNQNLPLTSSAANNQLDSHLNSLQQKQLQQMGVGADELRYHGTELVMLYDYKAQAPDDLSVRRGDWIYADLNNQTVDGWLWAYAPKTRKYGFIPKAYARPPAMTSL